MISSLNNFAARRTYKYVLFACAHYTITYSIFPERIQNMKKVKQILAIIGVIILAGLYVSTIVCAVSASENFMNMLMTSIYASVIIPVLIWAYSFIYKLIKKDSEKNQHLNKIFCQVLILLLSYLFFCVLNCLRAFCILCDCQLLNRF